MRQRSLGQTGRSMEFELSITIKRSPAEMFVFLRGKDQYPQEEGSPVLILEKTTPGPAREETHYREVVQMLSFYQGEVLSVIARFEPPESLEEDFWGAGMGGHLAYQFVPEGDGTRLSQRETLHCRGVLKVVEPPIKLFLDWKLNSRLKDIRAVLEGGYPVNLEDQR